MIVAYIVNSFDLTIRDVFNVESYKVEGDIDFGGKSTVSVARKPIVDEQDFIILKKNGESFFIGICSSVDNTNGEDLHVINCIEKENIFNRKIIIDADNEMLKTSTGVEDFIEACIIDNFVDSDDALLDLDYIDVRCLTHTPVAAKVPTENGIFNLKTYIANVMEKYGVFCDFDFESEPRKLIINITKKSQNDLKINTLSTDVDNYVENYEVDVLSKLTVMWNKPTTPCLYDNVNGKYYHRKSGESFTSVENGEYLEFTGDQYIDTEIPMTDNTSVELDFQMVDYDKTKSTGVVGACDNSKGLLFGVNKGYFAIKYGESAQGSTMCGDNVFKLFNNSGSVTNSGVIVEIQDNNTIKLNGTSTQHAWVEVLYKFGNDTKQQTNITLPLDNIIYTASCFIESGSYSGGGNFIFATTDGTSEIQTTVNYGTSKTFNGLNGLDRAYIYLGNGVTYNNLVIKLQVVKGDKPLPYQPYNTFIPIKVEGKNKLLSFEEGETSYFNSISNSYVSDTNYYKAVPLKDNWIHVECDYTDANSSTTSFINSFINKNKVPNLKPSTQYSVILEFRNVNKTKMSKVFDFGCTHSEQYYNIWERTSGWNVSPDKIVNGAKIIKNDCYTSASITTSYFLRNFHTIIKGDKFSYDYRISVVEGAITEYDYEPYGVADFNRHVIKLNSNGQCLFDNTVVATNEGIGDSLNTARTLYLGATNIGMINLAQMKLYSCKIWQDDTLVRDYIPAEDNIRETKLLEYYLKNDRSVTTDKDDTDRAKGSTDIQYSEASTLREVEETVTNAFKSNSYNHSIELSIYGQSAIYPANELYVGHECLIKTKAHGIKKSIITKIKRSSDSEYIALKFGNMAIKLIEKLRKERI